MHNYNKWIEALESGQYAQCQKRLYDGTGYCCLGVAVKTLGYTFDFQEDRYTIKGHLALLPPDIMQELGINWEEMSKLTQMNDLEMKTFPEIAQWLRRYAKNK